MMFVKFFFVFSAFACAYSQEKTASAKTAVQFGSADVIQEVTTLAQNLREESNPGQNSIDPAVDDNIPVVKILPKKEERSENLGNSNSNSSLTAAQLGAISKELEKAISAGSNASVNSVLENELEEDLATYEAPKFIQKNFPYYLAGHDEENHPIWAAEVGRMDFISLIEKGPEMQVAFEKYIRQGFYRILQSIKNASTEENPVTEAVYIVDADGLQLRQVSNVPTVVLVLKLARLFRDIIIDHLAATVIINANFLFYNALSLVKPIFGSAMAKVEVHGTNKDKWIPVLRRAFGKHNLPSFYGGSNPNYKPVAVYGR